MTGLRRLGRLALGSTALTTLALACATVDPSAPFVKPDASTKPITHDAGAYERCRLIERQFAADAKARVYGEAPDPQAVCVSLPLEVPAAGPGVVVFCVAGNLHDLAVPVVHDLEPNLQTCAYCSYIQTNCIADGGACATSYSVLHGSARIVRLGESTGDDVRIDVGDLEVARVTDTGLERLDCLFADALTLQGVVERGPGTSCTGSEEIACTIANTAADRTP